MYSFVRSNVERSQPVERHRHCIRGREHAARVDLALDADAEADDDAFEEYMCLYDMVAAVSEQTSY